MSTIFVTLDLSPDQHSMQQGSALAESGVEVDTTVVVSRMGEGAGEVMTLHMLVADRLAALLLSDWH